MAAPLLDEALNELLKEEKAMSRAWQGLPALKQEGRQKKRRTKNKAASIKSSDQAEVSAIDAAKLPGAQQQDPII